MHADSGHADTYLAPDGKAPQNQLINAYKSRFCCKETQSLRGEGILTLGMVTVHVLAAWRGTL